MNNRFEGKLAFKISQRMSELDLTSRELSNRTRISYEHIRKLIRGIAFPSPKALASLSKTLKISESQLQELADEDRILFKFRNSPAKISAVLKKNPELLPLERVWPELSRDQKNSVITLARMLAEQNRDKKSQ